MKRIILLLCLFTSASAFAQFSGEGKGTQSSPYQVTTAAQLDELRNCLKDEVYVKLMNDIDLTDYISTKYPDTGWVPINCIESYDIMTDDFIEYGCDYNVYLDGNNKTISGLNIKRKFWPVGLFGNFAGEMKNLTVECDIDFYDSSNSSDEYAGALCGYNNDGNFVKCEVKGNINCGVTAGGLCGFNDNGDFESCKFKSESEVYGTMGAGGICGYSLGGNYDKCYNYGNVGGDEGVGGIVGRGIAWITNCYSNGTIEANMGHAGGIMGIVYDSEITRCTSSGKISAKYKAAGGIVGSINGNNFFHEDDEDTYFEDYEAHIVSCHSYATVSSASNAGGILGECRDVLCVVDKCSFDGEVKMYELDEDFLDEGESWYDYGYMRNFGGIAGIMFGTVSNCLTSQSTSPLKSISGFSNVGGIVGYLRGNLSNSYAHGNVIGDQYVGGICGYVEGFSDRTASILGCCNYNSLVEVNTNDGAIGRIVSYIGNNTSIPWNGAAKANRANMYNPIKRKGAKLTCTENYLNGKDIPYSLISEKFFYESMGWDMDNTWYFNLFLGTDDYPFRLVDPYPDLGNRSAAGWATSGYHLRTEDAVINKNTGGSVKLVMSHSSSVHCMVGAQFDIVLPEGVTIKKKSNGTFDIKKLGVIKNHQVSCSQQEDGSYRILIYSLNMSRFDYEADYVMSIALDVAENVKCYYYDIIVKNVKYSQLWGDDATEVTTYEDWSTYNLLQITDGIPGDVNGDGELTVVDVTALVDKVLGNEVEPFNEGNADFNGDGSIDITDIMSVVNAIVNGSNSLSIPQNSNEEMNVYNEENGYLLQLGNMASYTALQMNVKLPEGCSLKSVDLDKARAEGHKVATHQLDDGSWNILIWSMEGKELSGSTTDLLHLRTTGHEADDVVVSNILLTNRDYESISIGSAVGGATGISEIEADKLEGEYYNLNGARVEHPTKGVYIHNGKKILVK